MGWRLDIKMLATSVAFGTAPDLWAERWCRLARLALSVSNKSRLLRLRLEELDSFLLL